MGPTEDILVARPPEARALPDRALFSGGPSASKATSVYAGKQVDRQTTKIQPAGVSKKSLPLSLNPSIRQHLERKVKRRRRRPSDWRQYYADRGTPCPPDCGACHLADKHYGTPFRFRLTLTYAIGESSSVDVFLRSLGPVAFYMCHFEEGRGDGQYHAHILIGGIYRPFLRALLRAWPGRTMLETLYDTWGAIHYMSTEDYDALTSPNYQEHWRPYGKNWRRNRLGKWVPTAPTSRPGWSGSAQQSGGRARAAKMSPEQRRAHSLKMHAAKRAKALERALNSSVGR